LLWTPDSLGDGIFVAAVAEVAVFPYQLYSGWSSGGRCVFGGFELKRGKDLPRTRMIHGVRLSSREQRYMNGVYNIILNRKM
jgi:hypothetical protein